MTASTFGVSLRFGLQICKPPECHRFFQLPPPVSCHHSSGHLPHYDTLDKSIKKSQATAGFFSQLEPARLERGDNKRPGGITISLFWCGRLFIWYSRHCDTYSSCNLVLSSTNPSSTEKDKLSRYQSLSERIMIKPVTFQTSSILSPKTISLLTATIVMIAVHKCKTL